MDILIRDINEYERELAKVKEDGSYFLKLKDKHKNIETITAAIDTCPEVLSVVPNNSKTYDMCFKAVGKNGLLLKSVPKCYRDYKLTIEAINENDMAIIYNYDAVSFKTLQFNPNYSDRCINAYRVDCRWIIISETIDNQDIEVHSKDELLSELTNYDKDKTISSVRFEFIEFLKELV